MTLDPGRLCIHQVTLMEQCDFRRSVECFARNGITKTAVWREKLEAFGVAEASRILKDQGVEATALCPGGFLTVPDAAAFEASLDDNKRLLEQAATLGAGILVAITGGLDPDKPDLAAARERALEGLARLVPEASSAGVRIALEPLHPMVCGLRSVLTTLGEANDWLDRLGLGADLGIALDSYAVWWDPALKREIARAGERVIAYHVSDWLTDTRDLRLDRGMPGDGVIDNRQIRAWIEAAGFAGPIEFEIFSARNWWRRDPDEVVRVILERYRTEV